MTREDERDMACTNWICNQKNGTVIKAREVWKAAVKWADHHPTPNWISVEERLPMNFGDVFMAFFMGIPLDKEEFDKFFDESFIKYFQDNPNGYDEAMRLIEEQVPLDYKDMMIERMNKIYEQSKKQQ